MTFAPLRFWSPSRILLLVLLATHHNGLEAFPAASTAAPPTALQALTPSDPTATFERSDAVVAAPPTATPTVGEAPAAVAPVAAVAAAPAASAVNTSSTWTVEERQYISSHFLGFTEGEEHTEYIGSFAVVPTWCADAAKKLCGKVWETVQKTLVIAPAGDLAPRPFYRLIFDGMKALNQGQQTPWQRLNQVVSMARMDFGNGDFVTPIADWPFDSPKVEPKLTSDELRQHIEVCTADAEFAKRFAPFVSDAVPLPYEGKTDEESNIGKVVFCVAALPEVTVALDFFHAASGSGTRMLGLGMLAASERLPGARKLVVSIDAEPSMNIPARWAMGMGCKDCAILQLAPGFMSEELLQPFCDKAGAQLAFFDTSGEGAAEFQNMFRGICKPKIIIATNIDSDQFHLYSLLQAPDSGYYLVMEAGSFGPSPFESERAKRNGGSVFGAQGGLGGRRSAVWLRK